MHAFAAGAKEFEHASCSRKWPTTRAAEEIDALKCVVSWAYARWRREYPRSTAVE